MIEYDKSSGVFKKFGLLDDVLTRELIDLPSRYRQDYIDVATSIEKLVNSPESESDMRVYNLTYIEYKLSKGTGFRYYTVNDSFVVMTNDSMSSMYLLERSGNRATRYIDGQFITGSPAIVNRGIAVLSGMYRDTTMRVRVQTDEVSSMHFYEGVLAMELKDFNKVRSLRFRGEQMKLYLKGSLGGAEYCCPTLDTSGYTIDIITDIHGFKYIMSANESIRVNDIFFHIKGDCKGVDEITDTSGFTEGFVVMDTESLNYLDFFRVFHKAEVYFKPNLDIFSYFMKLVLLLDYKDRCLKLFLVLREVLTMLVKNISYTTDSIDGVQEIPVLFAVYPDSEEEYGEGLIDRLTRLQEKGYKRYLAYDLGDHIMYIENGFLYADYTEQISQSLYGYESSLYFKRK